MVRRITPGRYKTDKQSFDLYFRTYEELFAPLADQPVHLLELGISQGGSLELWRDYFRKGTIAGIDVAPVSLSDRSGRIHVYRGLQQDCALLDRVRTETAPGGFDVIIDDCSHIGEFTALSFWHLFDRHLKPGGLYIIEDWGTGYMRGAPDGKSYHPRARAGSLRSRLRPVAERLLTHPAVAGRPLATRLVRAAMNRLVRMNFPSHTRGLVGFVKQLVDEAGMGDITHPDWGTPPARASKFRYVRFSHGQVIIEKAGIVPGADRTRTAKPPRPRGRRTPAPRR
ncbi:MAG TPA: class I SAM-dependent methyltransferase [Bacteroidota bacterium]|nr:class I SAM-dependent methyltransferase [Bacteroidota bacterium]